MLLDAARSSLLLVDMQERLLPAMSLAADVERRCGILIQAAKALHVPVTVTEQYPKGLGSTVPGLKAQLGNAPVFDKLAFSVWRDDALKAQMIRLHEQGRPQVIVAGIESHVCVLQSCVDLALAGFAVFAVADAMSSRMQASLDMALARLRHGNVEVVTTEMVVFELLGRAGTAEFKALSALIR